MKKFSFKLITFFLLTASALLILEGCSASGPKKHKSGGKRASGRMY